LTPTLPVTATQALLNEIVLPLTEKWNDPATALQRLIVGLMFLGLVDALALPATKKVLPMANTGATTSIRAECLRTFLCTMFSSHH
jgi:hypothetical protein